MAYTQKEIKKLLKGRTPEQQSVIKYFISGGGCLSSGLKDEQYESLVYDKVKGIDFKQRALDKIGLDESEVNEIEPVHFEGYYFDDRRTYAKWGKDKKWRSSAYQVSWLFFSSTQVYIYQYTINMDEDGKKEATEEYFYKDITNFSSMSDTVEKEVLDKVSCKGEASYTRKIVEYNRFTLVVPGERFNCSMDQNEYTESVIQAMKAKLREKKL